MTAVMNVQNKIIALMNKRIAHMRTEACDSLMAILVAALEAGILEGGLVDLSTCFKKTASGSSCDQRSSRAL